MDEPQVLPIVAWIDDPFTAGLGSSRIGGKAAGLAALASIGVPIPPAFVILPEAFDPPTSRGGKPTLSQAVRELIATAYLQLVEGTGTPRVAVRSSATVEDGTVASHAGQFLTTLQVCGPDAVTEAAINCAASLHSAAIDSYRAERLGTSDPIPARMAVVVQRMIDPDAAGVAFTVDPITGDRRSVVVNAARGLGTAVVDGTTSADRAWVDRESLRVTRQEPGTTHGMSVRTAVVATIARLAVAAESVVGGPADVEWAAKDGAVWFLQARPVTGITGPSVNRGGTNEPRSSSLNFPFEWPETTDAARHWRRDGRRNGGPATPWMEIEHESFTRAHDAASATLGRGTTRRTITLNGYRYSADQPDPVPAHVREAQRKAFDTAVLAVQSADRTFWEAALEPEISAGNRKLDLVNPDTLDGPGLADYFNDVLAWHERLWVLHLHVLHTVRFGPHTFRSQLESLLGRSVGPNAVAEIDAILSHVETLTSESVAALAQLARHVRANPRDAAAMLAWPAPAEPAPSPTVAAFRAEFREILDRFSLRADAGAFTVGESCQPGWRDRPDLPLAIIARYAAQDLDLLAARKEAAIVERESVVATIRSSFPDDESRASFERLLRLARREVAAYENHNHAIDASASALLWRARTAVAVRLQSVGVLESTDDVIWLSRPEIDAALRAPTDELGAVPWPELIGPRRALNRWQTALKPPDWLGAPTAPDAAEGPVTEPKPDTAVAPAPEGVLAVGQPGSRGRATGRVRHVPPDAEVPEVEAGDVLVARNAGALWSPVLPLAAAVVLEEGALLQHAMLICREFGVPGVVQAKGARSKLAEGALVSVDGTNGWVAPAERDP